MISIELSLIFYVFKINIKLYLKGKMFKERGAGVFIMLIFFEALHLHGN